MITISLTQLQEFPKLITGGIRFSLTTSAVNHMEHESITRDHRKDFRHTDTSLHGGNGVGTTRTSSFQAGTLRLHAAMTMTMTMMMDGLTGLSLLQSDCETLCRLWERRSRGSRVKSVNAADNWQNPPDGIQVMKKDRHRGDTESESLDEIYNVRDNTIISQGEAS